MTQDDKAWADYSSRFCTQVLPNLMDSAVFLSIGTDVGTFDVKQATELGAALLMDKPILLVLPKGRVLGERLRRAADIVVDNWDVDDPDAHDRLLAAMKQLGLES